MPAGAPLGAALYMGVDSGHGVGCGSSHHPGLGGGTLSPCPHPSTAPQVVPKPVAAMNATTIWPPHAQTPAGPYLRTVIINGKMPICDQDLLIPHPTPVQHTTTSVGFKCFCTVNTPAWWCTVGIAGGREAPTGHQRKLFATTATVFVQTLRLGRMSDPLGDTTVAFPCTSLVATASPNVYVGK
tara:strand:- start:408 stop:959 length:552 start_codon:yes stop_codon:yes gene_type:complete